MKESTLATSSKGTQSIKDITLAANAAMHAMERVNTGTLQQEGLNPHKERVTPWHDGIHVAKLTESTLANPARGTQSPREHARLASESMRHK